MKIINIFVATFYQRMESAKSKMQRKMGFKGLFLKESDTDQGHNQWKLLDGSKAKE